MTDLCDALESIASAMAVAIDEAKDSGADTVTIETSLENAKALHECIEGLLDAVE